MRTAFGPQRLVILAIGPGVNFDVFRIVRGALVDDPVVLNSLRSNFALGEEPRKVERNSTVIHMGISLYLDLDLARGTAERWPKLGDHIARIRLEHGQGVNYAHTGHPRHLTLWADPFKLRDAIVDIQAV